MGGWWWCPIFFAFLLLRECQTPGGRRREGRTGREGWVSGWGVRARERAMAHAIRKAKWGFTRVVRCCATAVVRVGVGLSPYRMGGDVFFFAGDRRRREGG